jgi:hypothetical protein
MMRLRWYLYPHLMRLSHRFNWHHTRTCYPDGDTLIVCDWCGLRYVARRRGQVDKVISVSGTAHVTTPAK